MDNSGFTHSSTNDLPRDDLTVSSDKAGNGSKGNNNDSFEDITKPQSQGSGYGVHTKKLGDAENGISPTFIDPKPNPESDTNVVNLRRNVGLFGSISLIVGTMIGSGIFVSPGGVFKNAGSVWFGLIIWVGCGILSTFGGITYIELSSVIPSSGAEYAYMLSTFGGIPGFLASWSQLTLIRPAQTATICLAFGQYAVDPFVEDLEDVRWAVKIVTSCAIIFLTYLNCMSTKLASKIQIVFTAAKLIAIAIVIVGGFYKIGTGHTENLKPDFDLITWNFGDIARAFVSGLWAYDGWNQLNIVTEEVEDLYKNFPRAILIGIPLVTICYLLTNIAFLTVMSLTEISEASSVAITYGDRVLGAASFLMPLGVVLSTFGAGNGTLFTAARVTYVAAREGHLPDALAYVDVKRNTPSIALIINSIIAIFLVVALDIEGLIDFFSFAAWILYGATAAAMIVLRFTRPDAPRPFKAPIWMPVIVIIMSGFLVIAPVILDPRVEYLYAALFILFGLVLYAPFVHFKWVVPGMEQITIGIQKIFQVAPEDGTEDETNKIK